MNKRKLVAGITVLSIIAVPAFASANRSSNDNPNNNMVASLEDNPARLNDDTPKTLVTDDKISVTSDDSIPSSSSSSSSSDNSVSGATLTQEDAIGIATSAYSGSSVRKVELETEHGVLVYSVRFNDGARVDVNSQTGEVVRTEVSEQQETRARSSDDSSHHDESDDDSGHHGSRHDDDDDHPEDD